MCGCGSSRWCLFLGWVTGVRPVHHPVPLTNPRTRRITSARLAWVALEEPESKMATPVAFPFRKETMSSITALFTCCCFFGGRVLVWLRVRWRGRRSNPPIYIYIYGSTPLPSHTSPLLSPTQPYTDPPPCLHTHRLFLAPTHLVQALLGLLVLEVEAGGVLPQPHQTPPVLRGVEHLRAIMGGKEIHR